jgi:biopolymer transport protein ExbD
MAFEIKKKKGPISDINVTPLVDVMLVLLVIFMVTAPLMLNGIKLSLPKTKEVNRVNLTATQVILSYTRAGDYYIGKDRFLANELIPKIKEEFKLNKTEMLFLRADDALKYGQVTRLMSQLKRAGITQISLVTELENK